jgi:nitroreductase
VNSKSGRGGCLGGIDIFLHGAPALVSAHADTSGMGASQDCTIALAYLDQDANAMGLGCCWLGCFTNAVNNFSPINDVVKLPTGHQIFGSMVIGYPK